jgi:hypothetical protein
MIHFLPTADCAPAPSPAPVAARLAGVGHALAVVEAIGGERPGPVHPVLAAATEAAGSDPLVAMLSERLALGSAAGLEALAELGDAGLEANPAAARMLADAIRDGLDAMGVVLSL